MFLREISTFALYWIVLDTPTEPAIGELSAKLKSVGEDRVVNSSRTEHSHPEKSIINAS